MKIENDYKSLPILGESRTTVCVTLYDLLKEIRDCHVVSLSDRKNEFVARGIDSTNVSVLPCGIDIDLYTLDEMMFSIQIDLLLLER